MRVSTRPFILFTGKGSEDVASAAFSAGASEYLQKESGTDQYTVLVNRIETVVENARAHRRQQRQPEAIEIAQEGIAILDEDGQYRYANERYGEIYGMEPAETCGLHWEEFYPADEIAYVNDEILATIDDVGYWHGQTTNLTANGETVELDHTISRTEDGGLVCTIRNLSEQEVLRFRTVTETLNDPVYVCDENGHFEYINDAFVELVGYERERLVGSHPSLVKSEVAVEVAEKNLGQILSDSGPDSVTFEVEIQPQDGEPIICEDHSLIVCSEDRERDQGIAHL